MTGLFESTGAMDSKQRIKRTFLTLSAVSGYALGRGLRHGAPGTFRVLTYHSVGHARRHETNVDPAAFGAQLDYLAHHCMVRDLGDLATRPDADSTVNKPHVAITLDDGYADNRHVAAPLLAERGLCATCFATVGYIGGERRLPHDHGQASAASGLLSWDELRELDAMGVGIGSHGMSHVRFAQLDNAALEREIMLSKQKLEEELSHPVSLLSFPYGRRGDYDPRAMDLATQAGYAAAATACYGVNRPDGNAMELRRIGIESSDTLFTFRAKLCGALDLLMLWEYPFTRAMIRAANRLLGA